MPRFDAAIVGSGFAGALLGRILASAGWKVALLERFRHPRFAIGESSTPLANLALERIGRSYDLPELISLAAHGRWLRSYPEVGRGLKRGFSFYRHRPGEPFVAGTDNQDRLLVAASPNDFVADNQWLRSDVDSLFVDLACKDGVELLDETELERLEIDDTGVTLTGKRHTGRLEVEASVVLDASGAGGFLRRALPIEAGEPLQTSSALVYTHFRDVPLLADVADVGAEGGELPYPEDWAAVHHLLDEGWMYILRFDDGTVSAGILLAGGVDRPSPIAPEELWDQIVSRYPTLMALFRAAEPIRPMGFDPGLQRRLASGHGPRWAVLPHTFGFVDPMFSTGIAWSLRGVERLAQTLTRSGPDDPTVASGEVFDRYSSLLAREVEHLDRLLAGAYTARRDMDLFAPLSMLYFALVSFAESDERLSAAPEPWWNGFLGADDPGTVALFEAALAGLDRALASGAARREFTDWVRERIEPWNVCGFLEPARRNHYPVDFDDLLRSAGKLGLSEQEIRAALPRLRGSVGPADL